ncbi:MAG TPA: hypothetical protein VLE51_03715 [Candidatus Saccharimonadales bacterium]|nr:hypothetical protein [Candidatus Saccharimonadales bacterium]
MFGSNDKNQTDNTKQTGDSSNKAPVANDAPPENTATQPEDTVVQTPPAPVVTPTAPPLSDPTAPEVQTPANDDKSATLNNANPENGYVNLPDPQASSSADDSSTQPSSASLVTASDDDELINIKQQALQSLAPLVDHLDQTPEEKFKTTMMLIQASDNASLVKEAYEAANAITDEKVRAQALLDVVNEINYFTQHQGD